MNKLFEKIKKDKITIKSWVFFSFLFIFISLFIGYNILFDKPRIEVNSEVYNVSFTLNGFQPDAIIINETLMIKDVSLVNKAVGMSMYPTLQTGNTIFYVAYPKDGKLPLKEGMIVRFKKDNSYITHRIVSLYNDYAITKGDNSNSVEEVKYKDIAHVAIGVLYT